MVPFTVFVPVVVALFLAIIGAYIYVHKIVCKSREELAKAIKENKEDRKEQFDKVSGRFDRLENHLGTIVASSQKLQVAYERRFTRLETKQGIPLPRENPPK